MELKLGFMSNAELAEWFGIKESTFRSKRTKKLEELKDYAEYIAVRGGVEIISIIRPEFFKGSNDRRIIEEEVPNVWKKDGLDLASNVTHRIFEKRDRELTIKYDTGYKYVRETRNKLWGNPLDDDSQCKYIWCKLDKNGEAQYLTEEEDKKRKDIATRFFGDVTDKTILVKAMIDNGELDPAEAWKYLEDITGLNSAGFGTYLDAVKRELGFGIVKGTQVEGMLQISNDSFAF